MDFNHMGNAGRRSTQYGVPKRKLCVLTLTEAAMVQNAYRTGRSDTKGVVLSQVIHPQPTSTRNVEKCECTS